MPIRLPVANWTQTRRLQSSTKAFDLSCAVLGAGAVGLSVFVARFCYEPSSAALMLVMAGGLIAVLTYGTCRGAPTDGEGP